MYETRVLAFIDILGFKSIVNLTVDKEGVDIEENIEKIVEAFNIIRRVLISEGEEDVYRALSFSKKVSIFSDSIAISFLAEEPQEVLYTLVEIKKLIVMLVGNGMLCRGAVVLGKLIHTDEYLFGPAIIKAHHLESQKAVYPRVLLDNKIAEICGDQKVGCGINIRRAMVDKLLTLDLVDNKYYIDYFSTVWGELDNPHSDFPRYILSLEKLIVDGLKSNDETVIKKFDWMRTKHNIMIDKVKSNMNYHNDNPKLKRFYENMKEI